MKNPSTRGGSGDRTCTDTMRAALALGIVRVYERERVRRECFDAKIRPGIHPVDVVMLGTVDKTGPGTRNKHQWQLELKMHHLSTLPDLLSEALL